MKDTQTEQAPPALGVAAGSGFCLWRVKYSTRFSSSSGMERYHIDHPNLSGYIATSGDSVRDVEATLSATLDSQSRLTSLDEAQYIGRLL